MRTVALWRSGSETLAGTNEVSFLKIKWGGQSHPKILDIRQATNKKKVRKKQRTSLQIMGGGGRKSTITSILLLISCFSFHF